VLKDWSECSREARLLAAKWLALNFERRESSADLDVNAERKFDVIDVLSEQGIGPEFLAKAVHEWIAVVAAKPAYIERGSPSRLELQRSPARRAARRRNLLHSPRGPNRHRELAAPLQTKRAHLSARLMSQPIQNRLEKASKLFFPIRRPANHGRPLQKPTTHESQNN
jgi:hypothetical protein